METTNNLVMGRLDPIQKRIDATESESIPDRWEFGHELRKQIPEGKKQLPRGMRAAITAKYQLESSEITWRMRLAEEFKTREDVTEACADTPWRRIIREILTKNPRKRVEKPWTDRAKARLDKLLDESCEYNRRDAFVALVAETARALGLKVVEAGS